MLDDLSTREFLQRLNFIGISNVSSVAPKVLDDLTLIALSHVPLVCIFSLLLLLIDSHIMPFTFVFMCLYQLSSAHVSHRIMFVPTHVSYNSVK